MSNLIKRCRCGYENPESESFCLQCGQPILDLEAVHPAPSAQPARLPPPLARTQKKCPHCGTLNEAYAMLCIGEHCGRPLDAKDLPTETSRADESVAAPPGIAPAPPPGIVPTPANAPEVTMRESRLYLVAGATQHECHEGDVLGREGTIASQVFNSIKTVSRRHVSISKQNGQWRVAALPGVANKTLLDGHDLSAAGAALAGDHTLRMSSQCEVKLRVLS